MRVLLINTNRCKDPIPVLPMGLCSIAASLENAGHDVRILDLCFVCNPAGAVRNGIDGFSPDIVGLGIRNIDTSNGYRPGFFINELKRSIVKPLKTLFTGPILIGGPAAGINGPDLLALLDLEYAVQGDGERAMCTVAQRLAAGGDLRGVRGLIIRRDGAVVEDNPPDFIEDLDTLPIPSIRKYLNLAGYRLYGTPLQVQTKRGCALGCAYCTYNRIEGRTYRLRSPRRIADEIESLVRETGIRTVEIVDSSFNAPPDHAAAVLAEIINRKMNVRFSTMGLNPKHVDTGFARLMKEAGFIEGCFGVEAACGEMLRALGKNFTVEDIRTAAAAMRRERIPASWFLLLGAPGETAATVKETFGAIAGLASPWDMVNIGVGIRVYNGAPIAARWTAENGAAPDDNFLQPVAYQPKGLSVSRIKALAVQATSLHHNFFMFDDGAHIPLPVRLLFCKVLRNQPVWKAYIVMRILEKVTGMFILRWVAVTLIGKLRKHGI